MDTLFILRLREIPSRNRSRRRGSQGRNRYRNIGPAATSLQATPLSVIGLLPIKSLSGQVLPPNGDTKRIPKNTPVNLAPVAAFFGGPITTNLTSVNFKNGYTMAGNVTLEQELPGEMALQVSYAINNAVGLYSSGSTYNALQGQLRKISAEHGIQVQACCPQKVDPALMPPPSRANTRGGGRRESQCCQPCSPTESDADEGSAVVIVVTAPVSQVRYSCAVCRG